MKQCSSCGEEFRTRRGLSMHIWKRHDSYFAVRATKNRGGVLKIYLPKKLCERLGMQHWWRSR